MSHDLRTHTWRCRAAGWHTQHVSKAYDPLTHTLTHLYTSLKFQSGHPSPLTVKKGIWIFWRYKSSHMQHISHHLTQGCLYDEEQLRHEVVTGFIRHSSCHGKFVSFLTKKINKFCACNLHENGERKSIWCSLAPYDSIQKYITKQLSCTSREKNRCMCLQHACLCMSVYVCTDTTRDQPCDIQLWEVSNKTRDVCKQIYCAMFPEGQISFS